MGFGPMNNFLMETMRARDVTVTAQICGELAHRSLPHWQHTGSLREPSNGPPPVPLIRPATFESCKKKCNAI